MRNNLLTTCIILVSLVQLACGQEKDVRVYASEIDGSVSISKKTIVFDVLDFANNGIQYKYNIDYISGIPFISYADTRGLFLISNEYLLLFSKDSKLLFEGVRSSGKMMQFIKPATSYVASSFLVEGSRKYSATNVSYLRLDLPWVEGVSGSGIGQFIDMKWDEDIFSLIIVNGIISDNKPQLYENNNRLKMIRIFLDGELKGKDYAILDTPCPQMLQLDKYAKSVRLEILDVYKGSKWDDTCISMIKGISADADGVIFQQIK
jgi:hypothetical protein